MDKTKIISLSNEYVSVDGSFGGSQMFFKDLPGILNRGRMKGGCGVVALNDTLRYLSGTTAYADKKSYIKSFKKTSRALLYISTRLGMIFPKLSLGSAFLLKKYNLPYKCHLVISKRGLYQKIYSMLSEDIPVIVNVPRIFGKNKKDRSLSFYDPQSLNVSARVEGHFVVITGITSVNDKTYFEISSWGKKYLISCDEYLHFLKKHPTSLLGCMLNISRRLPLH